MGWADASCALTRWQYFPVWNDVKVAILKVWRQIENPAANRCVFTWRIFLPSFVLIQFEMTKVAFFWREGNWALFNLIQKASIDGVRFPIWRHTFKMIAMMSFVNKKGLLTPAKRAIAAPPGESEYNRGSGRSDVFPYPSRIRRPRSLCCRWNFRVPFRVRKLKSHGATLWWRLRDPILNCLWLIHRCDGQTDGQTDRQTDRQMDGR